MVHVSEDPKYDLDQSDQTSRDTMDAFLKSFQVIERVEVVSEFEETGVADLFARPSCEVNELSGVFVHTNVPSSQDDDLPLRAREPLRHELDIEVLPRQYPLVVLDLAIQLLEEDSHPLLVRQMVQQPSRLVVGCRTIIGFVVEAAFIGKIRDG
jgi:hypothetical protein